MISKKLHQNICEQVGKEFYSAHLYLSMVSYFEVETLQGFATWLRVQAQEELGHGLIFFNYLSQIGQRVILPAIVPPPAESNPPADIFRQGLAHEKIVTASIYNLVDIAISDKDYATQRFLDWFINEQVEEESNFATVLGKLEKIKNSSEGLFLLDKELSTRTFVMPAPLAAPGA